MTYTKKGVIVSKGVTWLGLVGLFTATSNDYTIAINYRRTKENIEMYDMLSTLFRVIGLQYPVAYLVRKVVNSKLPYEDAVEMLSEESLISPCYITIYHHKKIEKSCVITRNSNDLHCQPRYWNARDHLIQTNTEPGGLNILFSDERKAKALDILKRESKSNRDFLVFPILNDEGIYAYLVDGEEQGQIVIL